LTADVVKKAGRDWTRILAWTTVAATAAGVAVLKWKPEWLDLLRSLY
jgi:hypothetical protein